MKLILLIIISLLSSFYATSQDYNFSIGLTYQPYFYQNYNKSDWNNRPESFPDNPGYFNGKALGITFNKPIANHFSMSSEITYSIQSQKHSIVSNSRYGPDNQTLNYYYGKNVVTEFEIFKFPVLPSITYEIGYKSGLYIHGFIGPQISFLNYYSSIYTHYGFDEVKIQIVENFIRNKIIRTPKYVKQRIWNEVLNPAAYSDYENETKYLYNKWLFGALTGFEFQKRISTHFLFGLGLRIDYDFTNSEKYPVLSFPELGGVGENGPRAISHNVRYGLSFSALYVFE